MERNPKCIEMKKIFIDGGARIGETVEVLLDKREDLKGCDVYLFECNSNHFNTLTELSRTNKNYNFIVKNEAIWVENKVMDFFISTDIWGDLGCTLDPTKRERLDLTNPLKVNAIDFSEFLLSFDKNDYIVVKLDIEGAEYEVIEHILNSGAINMVNELFIEWHDHFFNKSSAELKQKLSTYDIIINHNWM